jgi:hypothetical protein
MSKSQRAGFDFGLKYRHLLKQRKKHAEKAFMGSDQEEYLNQELMQI